MWYNLQHFWQATKNQHRFEFMNVCLTDSGSASTTHRSNTRNYKYSASKCGKRKCIFPLCGGCTEANDLNQLRNGPRLVRINTFFLYSFVRFTFPSWAKRREKFNGFPSFSSHMRSSIRIIEVDWPSHIMLRSRTASENNYTFSNCTLPVGAAAIFAMPIGIAQQTKQKNTHISYRKLHRAHSTRMPLGKRCKAIEIEEQQPTAAESVREVNNIRNLQNSNFLSGKSFRIFAHR